MTSRAVTTTPPSVNDGDTKWLPEQSGKATPTDIEQELRRGQYITMSTREGQPDPTTNPVQDSNLLPRQAAEGESSEPQKQPRNTSVSTSDCQKQIRSRY